MIIMPANNTHWLVHFWSGLYGGLGHLYSPGRRTVPMPHLPYVLDNGAFGAWAHGRVWSERDFLAHVEYYAFNALRPQWVVVPDVVADGALTLARWEHWAPKLQDEYHMQGRLALAVQDGLTPSDVRALALQPDVIFIGGTTEWKWRTLWDWAAAFPRVHVGRVNTASQLDLCQAAGAEGCDGTGWFRGKAEQLRDLGRFLAIQAGKDPAEVDHIVHFSRLKHLEQPAMPMDVAS